MAGTTYCHDNSDLSPWDRVGVANLFGKRVIGLSPIVVGFHAGRGDHGTMTSTTGINGLVSAGYKWINTDGWLFDMQVPTSLPLKLYWHQARGDFYSTATAAGQTAATNAGYTFVRNEGYVYPTQRPGTVPLQLYWHAGRQDFPTVTSPTINRVGAGYVFVRTEGYVFPRHQTPYRTIMSFFHAGRGDNLTTTHEHPNSEESDAAGYVYNGVDGAVEIVGRRAFIARRGRADLLHRMLLGASPIRQDVYVGKASRTKGRATRAESERAHRAGCR